MDYFFCENKFPIEHLLDMGIGFIGSGSSMVFILGRLTFKIVGKVNALLQILFLDLSIVYFGIFGAPKL